RSNRGSAGEARGRGVPSHARPGVGRRRQARRAFDDRPARPRRAPRRHREGENPAAACVARRAPSECEQLDGGSGRDPAPRMVGASVTHEARRRHDRRTGTSRWHGHRSAAARNGFPAATERADHEDTGRSQGARFQDLAAAGSVHARALRHEVDAVTEGKAGGAAMNPRRIASAAVAAALGVLAIASMAPPARAQCTYYSIDTLSTYGVVANPADIQLQQTQSVWSAFAIRPVAGEDWDVTLYQNSAAFPTCVTNYLAGSSYGGSIVDFVIGDYSHDPAGTYYARCNHFSGTNFAYVRWCESSKIMTVNGPLVAKTWNANDVMETWSIQLSAGTTYTVNFTPFGLDGKVLLFRNPSGG